MKAIELHARIAFIRDAFFYARRYRGQCFIICLDDRLLDHIQIPTLISDIALLRTIGIGIVVVADAAFHIETALSHSQRPTGGAAVVDDSDIAIIEHTAYACAGRLVSMLAAEEVQGVIGSWITATDIGVRNGVDWGRRGAIGAIDSARLRSVLLQSLIPIIPCVSWNRSGKIYELMARTLALHIAHALKAEKIFFVCAEPEIGPDDYPLPDDVTLNESGRVSHLTLQQIEQLSTYSPTILPGVDPANSGPPPSSRARQPDRPLLLNDLLRHAYWAVKQAATKRVHIVDGRRAGALLGEIFSAVGVGTLVSSRRTEHIRPMREGDIQEMLRVMRPWIEDGILVSRSADTLREQMQDFVVYSIDGAIHGCGALRIIDNQTGLIEAIAVNRQQERLGIGGDIIRHLLGIARQRSLRSLYVQTTRTADWFERFGFRQVAPDELPPDLARAYNPQRRPRVLRYELAGSS